MINYCHLVKDKQVILTLEDFMKINLKKVIV